MPYTAAQKAAFAKKMAALRAAKAKPSPRGYISGTGAYNFAPLKARVKKASKGLAPVLGSKAGHLLGAAIGGTPGAALGAMAGKGLGKIFQKLTGWGDYKVDENSILAGGMSPPEVINSVDRGGFIVRHREYIQDINATTAFTKTTIAINPGLLASFPWLSQIADGFEQYRFRGLVFEFKSMSSDAVLSSATSSALGTVIMATQYNTGQSTFNDKREMENYEFANSDKPSCSFYHPVECKTSQSASAGLLYIRPGAVPANQDQRWFDLGQFTIATQGMQAASGVAGELWASFEIEFYKPKLNSETGLQIMSDHSALSGTVDATHPLGTTSVMKSGSSLNGTISSGTTYSFPSGLGDGEYLMTWTVIGTGTAALAIPTLTLTNCSLVSIFNNDGGGSFGQGAGATSTVSFIIACIKLTAPAATVAFGTAGTLPASITGADLVVTQINSGILT